MMTLCTHDDDDHDGDGEGRGRFLGFCASFFLCWWLVEVLEREEQGLLRTCFFLAAAAGGGEIWMQSNCGEYSEECSATWDQRYLTYNAHLDILVLELDNVQNSEFSL